MSPSGLNTEFQTILPSWTWKLEMEGGAEPLAISQIMTSSFVVYTIVRPSGLQAMVLRLLSELRVWITSARPTSHSLIRPSSPEARVFPSGLHTKSNILEIGSPSLLRVLTTSARCMSHNLIPSDALNAKVRPSGFQTIGPQESSGGSCKISDRSISHNLIPSYVLNAKVRPSGLHPTEGLMSSVSSSPPKVSDKLNPLHIPQPDMVMVT